MTMIYSRHDLQNDASAAVRATESGPVIITENGSSAYVLLSLKDYEALGGASSASSPGDKRSAYAALSKPEFEALAEVDLDLPPRTVDGHTRVADLD